MSFLIKQIITKKSIFLKKKKNIYTFIVNNNINKIELKKIIYNNYGLSVKKIRTSIYLPKIIKKNTKNGVFLGKTNKIKKAFIELKKGNSLNFYSK